LWKNYDEEAENEKRRKKKEASQEILNKPKQVIGVIVTEIVDASKFYVQVVGPDAEKLEELMKSLAVEESQPHKPKNDELVRAQFTADDAWYRAKVIEVQADDNYKVLYLDYGNWEVLPGPRITKLNDKHRELQPQAFEARLAYVAPPTLEEEYGKEAAEFLKELVWGKTMVANVEEQTSDLLQLTLADPETQIHVNAALLRAGLSRVEKRRERHLRPLLDKLKEEEQKAKSSHVYIWEYGDPGSDEDEDGDKSKGLKGKKQ